MQVLLSSYRRGWTALRAELPVLADQPRPPAEMENGVGSSGPYDFPAARCDAVITAVGDCGSCSAQDAAEIERRAVAAASLCTKPFVPVARSMACMQVSTTPSLPGLSIL